MNAQEINELTLLLTGVLNSATIQTSRGRQLDLNQFRGALRQCREKYNPSLILETALYDPDISDPDVKQRVLDLVKSQLSEYIDNDRIQSATIAFGSGLVPGAPVEKILQNILKRAIVDGIHTSVGAFARSTSENSCSFQEFHLLTGVRAHREVQLFDGIWLIPLPSSTAELPSYLPVTFGDGVHNIFKSKTLLRIEHSVSPIFVNPTRIDLDTQIPSDVFDVGIHSIDVPTFDVAAFCQALSLTCDCSVESVMSWQCLLDYEVFDLRSPPGVGAFGHAGDFRAANTTNRTMLDAVRLDNAKTLYHALTGLPQETRDQLEIPITRWARSHASNALVDQMIDLGIALESLYLSDGDLNEITYKFSLRAAWHLGRDKLERDRMVQELRAIYRGRSLAVHRGTLPQNVKIAGTSVPTAELVRHAQAVCSRSIKSIIDSGQFPDWDNLVLGT